MNRSHARATASAILLACAGLAGCAQAGSAIRAEEQADRASDDPAYWEALPPVQQAIAAARQYYEEAYARSPVQFEASIRVRDTTTGAFPRCGRRP